MAFDSENQFAAIESEVPLCQNENKESPMQDEDVTEEKKIRCCERCNHSVIRCCSETAVMLEDFKQSKIARYGREFFTKKNARRKFPFISWVPKYRLKHFIGDLVAGLTVGLTVIPQGLAYAVVAELPPQYGLYSAFMGVFIYAFLGTSKDITLGPTAIMSLMIAEFASEKSPVHNDPTYAIVLTLFCGIILLVMGLLNMGFIVQFISFPVISGFTSAAAVTIGFGQVRKLLGLKNVPRGFLPQVKATFEKIGETNLWDMGFGISCLIILILMKKLKEAVDARMKESSGLKKAVFKLIWLVCTARNAVIVVLTAGIAAVLKDIYSIEGLTLTGKIESGMLPPMVPKLSMEYIDHDTNKTVFVSTGKIFSDMAEGFGMITLIAMLESIAIAKAFARRNDYRIDASQELIAIGIANAVSAFFHSYPVTGSFSRTAINSQSGVRTPAGGIWTGGLVIVAIVVLTPYFYYIPQAVLAAMIISAVIAMVEYEVVYTLWKVKKMDLLPLFITFLTCLFWNIEYGIIVGIGFSQLMVLLPMARPSLKVHYKKASDHLESPADPQMQAVVLEPAQGLNFPGVEYIKDKVMKHGVYEDPPRPIVLDASHFDGCDYTMIQGITQICDYFSKHDLTFVISGCPEEIRAALDRAKIKKITHCDSVKDSLLHIFDPNAYAVPAADANGNAYQYDNGAADITDEEKFVKDESV